MSKGTVGRDLKHGFRRSLTRKSHLPWAAAGTAALVLGAVAMSGIAPGFGPRGDEARVAALSPLTVVSVEAPGPSVWLTALDVPGQTPFAGHGFTTAPILPRVVLPLPPLPDREPVQAQVGAPSQPPVQEPVQEPAQPAALSDRAAPQPAQPQAETPALLAPGLAAALSEALRRQGVEPISGGLVIARLAPRRSVLPRARPPGIAPVQTMPTVQAVPTAPVADEPVTDEPVLALARSVIPQRRPAAVARLASLDLSVPALAIAPQTGTERLQVPEIGRALARADQCQSRLTRAIPRRGRAEDGSAVIARLASANGRNRDDAVINEIAQGNLPDFLRDLVPVTFDGTGPGGQPVRVTVCVMPDYLAVGSDRDFVRVPLGLPAAMRVAERFDMVLPTTAMVDAIYRQASVRLAPSPMTPGSQMETTGYFNRHNATVQRQLASAGGQLGQLVSGHKKDLVLTNRLERNPGRVAIYGWHRPSGRPIQPLSTVHGAQYADYSHGIRLVARTAYVNGAETDLRDLLSDGRYAGLVSSEGPITNRTLLAALR